MDESKETMSSITIKATCEIKNNSCSCHDSELDLWYNHKDDPHFKYCPFCGKALWRSIYFIQHDCISHTHDIELKKPNQINKKVKKE